MCVVEVRVRVRKGKTGGEGAEASLAIRHPAWHQRCSRVCLSLCPVSILRCSSALRMNSYSAPISTVLGLQSLKTVLANICSSSYLVSEWRSFSLHCSLYNSFLFHSNLVQNPTPPFSLSTSGFEITNKTQAAGNTGTLQMA